MSDCAEFEAYLALRADGALQHPGAARQRTVVLGYVRHRLRRAVV
jgi:hypothetical protein